MLAFWLPGDIFNFNLQSLIKYQLEEPEFLPLLLGLDKSCKEKKLNSCKDTADDAAHGPGPDTEAHQVDGPAVDVRVHVERQQRLNDDVKSSETEGENRPHEVHVEQRRLLLWQAHGRHVNTEPEQVENHPTPALTWKLATTHMPKELVQPSQSPTQFSLWSLKSSSPSKPSTCL